MIVQAEFLRLQHPCGYCGTLVVTPVVHELAAVAKATDAGLSVIFAAHWIIIPSHCGSDIGGSPEETSIEMLVQVL